MFPFSKHSKVQGSGSERQKGLDIAVGIDNVPHIISTSSSSNRLSSDGNEWWTFITLSYDSRRITVIDSDLFYFTDQSTK